MIVLEKYGEAKPLHGNPTLTSLDGEERCTLGSIRDSSPERLAAFGIYLVDVTPPEGQVWAGTFAGDPPEAVFEDLPPPSVNETILNAPRQGFGGPTGKDLFNGNL